MWSMRFFFPLNTCVKSALGPETAAICASLGFPSRSPIPRIRLSVGEPGVSLVVDTNGVVYVGYPAATTF